MDGRRGEARRDGAGGGREGSQETEDSARIPDSAGDGTGGAAGAFARAMRQAAPFIAASSTLTGALLFGSFGGWWLDRRFGTKPWLTLAGVLLGAATGLYQLARVALRRDGERR